MQLRFLNKVIRVGNELKPIKVLQFREELDDDGYSYWSEWEDVPEVYDESERNK